jgi:PAS domain S-box-containing protein
MFWRHLKVNKITNFGSVLVLCVGAAVLAGLLILFVGVTIPFAIAAAVVVISVASPAMNLRRRDAREAELVERCENLQHELDERNLEIRRCTADLSVEVARRQEASEQLRSSLELANVAIWTWYPEEDKTVWAGSVEGVFGRSGEQLSNTAAFREVIFPADQSLVENLLADTKKENSKLYGQFRIVRPNGEIRWIAALGNLVRDGAGRLACVSGVNLDVSERRRVELDLEESENYFRALAESVPQIVWGSLPTGEMDYCNGLFYEFTGYELPANGIVEWRELIHPDDFPKYKMETKRGFASGQPFEIEFRLKRGSDGAYFWHLARSVPFRDLQGNLLRWFGAASNIHEQKLSKQRLEAEILQCAAAMQQLEIKETQLTRSLAEKNTLFHEMHHRVKNNLQVISSLLRMKAETLQDPVAIAALTESHQRVISMALIHEQLYSNEKGSQIDFESFTQKLVSELFHSYIGSAGRVNYRLNTEQVYLKIDHAIPLGLILNELVTNSLKYAYPNEMVGDVVVELQKFSDGNVSLTVADEGVGLPEGFDWSESASMGLPIVEVLTQQLEGKLTFTGRPGTTFAINFLTEIEKADAASAA